MKRILSVILAVIMIAGCAPIALGALTSSADEQKPMPAAVTLVGTDFLPPIGNQGGVGCCVSMAATYMQLSNAVARQKYEEDPATEWKPATGDPAYCFSPRFTYNLGGSGTAWVYEILKEQGAPPQTYAAFSGGVTGWAPRDAISKNWAVEDGVWDIAQQYRITDYDQVWIKDVCTERYKVTTTEAGSALLARIKSALVAGNVIVTGGYPDRWVTDLVEISGTGTYGNAGDKAIPYSTDVSSGGHQVSIVGYDDNITCEKNGVVLKGAFLVANSWGTTWGNSGYLWLMYDAFNGKDESPYAALNVENRTWTMDQLVFHDWRTELNLGIPELAVKLTVTSNDEDSFSAVLTRTEKATGKVTTYKPYFFTYMDRRANYGNGLAFNGTVSEKGNTAVMTFNYDKLLAKMPAGTSIDDYLWGIRVEGVKNALTTVNEVKLVRNGEVVGAYAPMNDKIENGKSKTFNPSAELSGTWENGGWTFHGGMLTVYGKGAMPDFRGREDERPWADFADEITRVVIGYGVTNVGSSAFTHCDNLATVICGKDVTALGMDAFSYDGSLKSIVFYGPVTEIGQGTVYSSGNLETVKLTGQTAEDFLAAAAVKLYNDAYTGAEITGDDPAEVVIGGEWSYNGSASNCGRWTFADGVLTFSGSGYMQDYTADNFTTRPWQPYADEVTKIVINDGVTITGRYCFANMKNLTEFYGSKTMNYLETATFTGCSALKIIVLQKSISNFKDDVVKGCDALEYVYVKDQTPDEFLTGMQRCSGNDAFANATITQADPNDRTEWSYENGVLTISGTGKMEDYRGKESQRPWIDYIKQITKVIIEDGVTHVGSSAFTSCSKLQEVICGVDVTTLGMDAFSYCSALKTIVFGGPVTEIGQGVVYSSDALKNVTITDQTKAEFLAVARRNSYNDAFTKATFTVNDNRVPDLPYDLNGDEEQNVCDATVILNLLATSKELAAERYADLDCDGVVTIIDVTMLFAGLGA